MDSVDQVSSDQVVAAMLLSQVPEPSVHYVDPTTGIVSPFDDDEKERILHIMRAREQRNDALFKQQTHAR